MAKAVTTLLIFSSMLIAAFAVGGFYSDNREDIPIKKGLTLSATVFPEEDNSFVGRMSCDGCDANNGDTACTVKIPILCIVHPKVLDRPFYNFYPEFTPYDNPDESFYEGWTGGIFTVTDPIRGLEITSYKFGDDTCKNAYGPNAKFASFTDGWYMDQMNGAQLKIEKIWNWTQAKSGEFNLWGYFNHNYQGRAWIWSSSTPYGNCAAMNWAGQIGGN